MLFTHTSEKIDELAKALIAAQAEFSAIPKGSVNPFFKSKYAALPEVISHTTPVLVKNGLAVSQHIDFDGANDILCTYLLHSSGQFIAHNMKLHLVKDDPQAQGSAVTYARRYSYMAVLGLVADEDDDGNMASKPAPSNSAWSEPRKAQTSAPANASGDVESILRANEIDPSDEFIASLAKQYKERGSLSEKQIVAGRKRAVQIIKSSPVKDSAQIIKQVFETEEETF
jgi:hypothetical protein